MLLSFINSQTLPVYTLTSHHFHLGRGSIDLFPISVAAWAEEPHSPDRAWAAGRLAPGTVWDRGAALGAAPHGSVRAAPRTLQHPLGISCTGLRWADILELHLCLSLRSHRDLEIGSCS